MQNDGDGVHGCPARLVQMCGLLRSSFGACLWKREATALRLRVGRVCWCTDMDAVVWTGDGEHAGDEDGSAFWLLERVLARVSTRKVGRWVRGREGLGQVAPPPKAVSTPERGGEVVYARPQHGRLWLGRERHNVHLVRVAAVGHARAAKHAFEAGVDQIRRLSGAGVGVGVCVCLDLAMFVDVGHGGDGRAAGASAGEAAHGGRPRRRLCRERGPTGVEAAKGRRGGAGRRSVGAAKAPRARVRVRVRVRGRGGRRRARLAVEQHRLGHVGKVILGDDDAHVARELEVDLRERPVVAAPGRQRRGVQRVRLAVGVEQGAAVRVEQMARVRLLGRRVERRRGRGAVGGVVAFAAAEELADHVWQRAQSAESSVLHAPPHLSVKA